MSFDFLKADIRCLWTCAVVFVRRWTGYIPRSFTNLGINSSFVYGLGILHSSMDEVYSPFVYGLGYSSTVRLWHIAR